MKKTVLVTGAAGFIGMHLCRALLERGLEVIGIDNLNDYYDPKLKLARLKQLEGRPGFRFLKLDISNTNETSELFRSYKFDRVAHLAAQVGVRYSVKNPHSYISSNILGFTNILEGCRHSGVKHLVYASSSSVYGLNAKMPFSTEDKTDQPVSLYGATKKANELMAHSYSHLYGLPTTGLRFFTVYGPWGRPDMAPMLFADAISSGKTLDVFNNGEMKRDFTYVGDVVESLVRILDIIPSASGKVPFEVYNIGNHTPVELMTFIKTLEDALEKKAKLYFLPMQPGDMTATYADVSALEKATGFTPKTSLKEGISKFIQWYRER
ncbi:MAG: NAD-dependent epimerase [Xanthomonadaceae bacterium]|nr:NAD-dependent epimerase [Xanthomonadaceae bacterium]